MIERNDSQQTTCNAMITLDGGERRQAASATCAIRPGKSMNFAIDLVLPEEITDEQLQEIGAMFKDYMSSELTKAQQLGIPI